MINSFVVRGLKENNRLVIMLDGYFMESEIDLTLHLIKSETKKLSPGFGVLIDIHNLDSQDKNLKQNLNIIKNLLKELGSGKFVFKGTEYGTRLNNSNSVGFYPHEIGWNLS